MNLTLLLPDLRGGGAERVTLDLAHAFAGMGHAVDLLVMREDGEYLREAQQNFQVHSLNSPRLRHAIAPMVGYLRQTRPDALIAMMWPLTSAAVLARALSRQQLKLLLVEHNTLSRQYASWGRLHLAAMKASMMATYRLAESVAAVSEGAAADTAKMAAMAGNRVQCVHNPIPQRKPPHPSSLRQVDAIWNCPPGRRILTVGSLKAQKNHALLLRAFASLGARDARLMLLGQGEKQKEMERLATDLGIAERVIFAGFHPDPSPFYATADLFALSSDYEGFGNVIVEAMAHGLPVVSTDCPSGPGEILGGGRWGRLVPTGDVTALALAMEEALTHPVDPAVQKARAADFAPDIAARRYLSLMGLT